MKTHTYINNLYKPVLALLLTTLARINIRANTNKRNEAVSKVKK